MMINGYASAKMRSQAERIFQALQDSGLRPDTVTFNTLISMYIRCRRRKQVSCNPLLSRDLLNVPSIFSPLVIYVFWSCADYNYR